MQKWLPGMVVMLTLLVALIPDGARAQMWTLRTNAGYSNSSFYGGTKLLGDESRNGFAAGIAADYRRQLGDAWSFEFGAYYVQKGAEGKIERNPVDPVQPPIDFAFDGTTKLDYLEFSFLFVGHLATGTNSEIRAYLGPALGNLLRARAKGVLDGEDVDLDIKDNLHTAEFEVVAGIGFTYYLKNDMGLMIDFRNVLGATSIVGDEFPNDLYTRTHELLVGVSIPLTRGE
ncbi:MAG: outer membrane beta-barrel protein [bacterium]